MISIKTGNRRLMLGYLASLGAAMAYGTSAVLGRKIVGDVAPPLVLTAFSLLFGTLMVGALFFRQVAADLSIPKPKNAWLYASLAGCAAAWGIGFFFWSLAKAPVVVVAPLVGTSPLFAIALTHVFLQRLETVTWRTILGAVLVVIGVVLITFGGQQQ